MEGSTGTRGRWLVLAAALAMTALGVAAKAREGGGWGGFIYGPDRVVGVVEPGSAADAAGLRRGDSVISVDGRPAEDLPMQSRWEITRVGETKRLVVRRDGALVTADVTYRSRGTNMLALGALAVMLAFLWCGVWAGLAVGTVHSGDLARAGLAAGGAAASFPSVGGIWSGVLSHVQTACLLLLAVLLLRFFLRFPRPKRVSASRLADVAMSGSVALLVAFEALEMAVHPRLYYATGSVFGLLMTVIVCLALAAIVHTALTAPRGETWRSGMGLALLGVAAALLGGVVPILGPMAGLPGAGYYGLLFVALPLALALAVWKNARQETAPAA